MVIGRHVRRRRRRGLFASAAGGAAFRQSRAAVNDERRSFPSADNTARMRGFAACTRQPVAAQRIGHFRRRCDDI